MSKANLKIAKKEKVNNLSKTLIVFLAYFGYSYLFSILQPVLGLGKVLTLFISDFVFMLFIAIFYKNEIKQAFKKLSKNYSIGKLLKVIFIWVALIFILNIVMGAITDYFYPNLSIDQNTSSIDKMASLSFAYTAFKTLFFAVIAEELLFREAIRSLLKNNFLFIIISGALYTLMNFLYVDLGVKDIGIYLLMYFFPALLMSFAYIKNKDNILLTMLIKFFYNLIIPFTLLVFEVLNK